MRLFRKSKSAQEPSVHVEEEQRLEALNHKPEDQKPSLPPALQLNFELPPLPSSSLDFGAQTTKDESSSDDQPLLDPSSQHLNPPSTTTSHVQQPPPVSANVKPQMTLFEQLSQEQRKLSDYDYLPDIEESSAQNPKDIVKEQLWEQFGNRHTSQNIPPSGAGNSAPNLLQSQKRSQPQAMHQQIEQILAANSRAQPSKSVSSNEESSSSEDDTQKLSQSMAAMSLTNTKSQTESGMQLSDRALHIQKMREASALGKLSVFNKAGTSVDIEDENDSVPLGGLRQVKNGALKSQLSSGGPHPQQMGYMVHHGLGGQPMQEFAQASQSPRQAAFRQSQMAMLSPSAAAKPYAFVPLAGARETEQPCGPPYGVSHHNMSLQSLPTMHNAQASPRQQAGYPRTAAAAISGAPSQPVAMNHMYRPHLSGASSVTYGNVGLSRGAVMQDPSKMYTPSPLSQAPMYSQAAMNNGYMPPQMAAIANAMHAAAPQHQPMPHLQQHQQPQSAALMSYIPNHDRCRGSMAKNPLMRDINKAKQFSAQDYTSRPTLLAEADSRRLAKRNMPGLGGTTCHSFQPEPMPVAQPQLAPSDTYSPPQTPGHRNYPEYSREPARHTHRSENPRRRPSSRQLYDDPGYGYMSSSSSISNKRRSMRREARPKRHDKYDTYDRHFDRPPVNEFRHREHRGRSRGTLSRHLQKRRHHDPTYDYYDYDEYPDSFSSDYYDEWEGEYDCYEQERHPHRRGSRGGPRHRMSRPDGHRPHRSHKWDEARDGHRRHRSAHLDDPRDSNGIVLAATKQRGQQDLANAAGSIAQGGRPRSQFGRILANMKRKSEASKPASPSMPAEPSSETKEAAVEDDSRQETEEQPELEQSDKASLPDGQAAFDRPPSSASNACSEASVNSAPNSACTTPVVPAATVAVS